MFEQKDIEALNTNIEIWADNTQQKVVDQINALNIKHYPYSTNPVPLSKAIKNTVSKKNGLASRIGYKMPRSGVFVHKGVSRGHGINNPRTAKEWFEPPIDANLDELRDIVADGQGTLIINALKIK